MALDTRGLAISTIGSTGSIYCYIPKVHFPDAAGNKDLCEESVMSLSLQGFIPLQQIV